MTSASDIGADQIPDGYLPTPPTPVPAPGPEKLRSRIADIKPRQPTFKFTPDDYLTNYRAPKPLPWILDIHLPPCLSRFGWRAWSIIGPILVIAAVTIGYAHFIGPGNTRLQQECSYLAANGPSSQAVASCGDANDR